MALAASGSTMKLYLRSHSGPFVRSVHYLRRCLIRREWLPKADAIYLIQHRIRNIM